MTHLDEVTPIVDGDQAIMSMHNRHLVISFLSLRYLTFAISVERLTQRLHSNVIQCVIMLLLSLLSQCVGVTRIFAMSF